MNEDSVTQDRVFSLLTKFDDVSVMRNRVGLLFECAPDSPIMDAFTETLTLGDLIGDFDTTKEHAYRLARKLLQNEPAFRGIKQLGIFEEVVIRELQFILHSIQLYNALLARNVEQCQISSRTRCIEGLMKILKRVPGTIKLTVERDRQMQGGWRALVSRITKRLKDSSFSLQALQAEYRLVLARVDPYHKRSAFLPAFGKQSHKHGKVWFYSTSYTFTRIGLMYEPYFADGFTYLVENPLTGGRALDESGRGHVDLYKFVNKGMGPSREEVSAVKEQIIRHISEITLTGDEAQARDLFLESDWLALFMARHLPAGLFQSALFAEILDDVKPSAIVVGNPVHEAYLLHCAKKKEIPTILLQHGILGDFCQLLDPPVDHYVVRGSFWQEFLSPEARKRSIILNPPHTLNSTESADNYADPEKHILFLTAPYGVHEFMHLADLDDIIASLLQVASRDNIKLIVRVHPSESVGYYRQIVERLTSKMCLFNVRVAYSQGPGLEDMVRKSAVAVTYCSTVILDCLRLNIPIVSFSWHDFSYKKQIAKMKVFYFAHNLKELRELVTEGVMGNLVPFAGNVEPFLAMTSQDDLKDFVRKALSKEVSVNE